MIKITYPLAHSYLENWKLEDMKDHNGLKPIDPLNISLEDEVKFAREFPIENQKAWILERLGILDAQKEIVTESFDFCDKSVAEFGCGAYGYFYNFLLSKRKNWIQFDINPNAVEKNKKFSKTLFRFPEVKVGNIYQMPLEDKSVDVVMGFNSWDCISFFERGVKEVKRILKPKGYFVHFQELNPAEGVFLCLESKKRRERGMNPEFKVRMLNQKIPLYLGKVEAGYEVRKYVIGIDSLDWGEVRLGEYMQYHLREVFQGSNFETETCKGIEKEVIVPKEYFKKRMQEFTGGIIGKLPNSFGKGFGVFNTKDDSSLPYGKISQWAHMDIFVASKN